MTTRIIGTGSYVPDMIVSNDALSQIVDTSDQWIRERTGIQRRRIAASQSTSSMAAQAAKRALLDAGIQADQLDFIITATSTPDCHFPNTACQVQKELGAFGAMCYDISAACTGFIYALGTAHAFLQSGIYSRGLVIGADCMSRVTDWSDRGTCILFGDGAGAAVVAADQEGLIHMILKADASKDQALVCEAGRPENRLLHQPATQGYMSMDGQEVFKFAVRRVPESIHSLLEESSTDVSQVKAFLLHQANQRIIASAAKRLSVPLERFPMNLSGLGNTSGASVPILLDECNREGRLRRGDLIVLSGFGAGLTWGSILTRW